ncbi:MAG: hypothetical protein JJ974_04675 [Phycisphaerales bacterium]|nr:hypothetical protein [Phycisphaerales bacterium]
MSTEMQRRAFLAAGAVSIPSIALARTGQVGMEADRGMQFHKLMGQSGDHLKSMRRYLRDLEAPGARAEAAFLANQVTILLAQCVMVADQESIPVQSVEKYDGDKERFVTDMQIKLMSAVSASNALGRQLLLGNDEEAISIYGDLRRERNEGHDEFISEDD